MSMIFIIKKFINDEKFFATTALWSQFSSDAEAQKRVDMPF